MPKCKTCNYELVLLSNRPKYKCAVCSGLYPKKEIENKEFRKWNKWQRELDKQNLLLEELKRKELLREKKLLRGFRMLFKRKEKPYSSGKLREVIFKITLDGQIEREDLTELKELKRSIKLLFNPKRDLKEYQRLYRQKNKERLNQKAKEWRLRHREYELNRYKKYYQKNKKIKCFKAKERRKKNKDVESRRQKRWRKKNLEMVRIYGMIHHYRQKQKELAVRWFEDEQYRPCNYETEASLSTWALSYLLNKE